MNLNNPCREILLEKVTLNIGTGTGSEQLQKAVKLLEKLAQQKPISRASKLRIPTWGVRPGLEVGCKVTLRGDKAEKIITRLLKAVNSQISKSAFDPWGNFSFGIHEYLLIPGAEYDPEVGIMGLQVVATLARKGYRITRRHVLKRRLPKKHRVQPEEAMAFVKKKWSVEVV